MFDQTRKFDGNKLRMDLIPPQAISAIAEVLTYLVTKEAQDNGYQQLTLDDCSP